MAQQFNVSPAEKNTPVNLLQVTGALSLPALNSAAAVDR
jgi:hypothetical protein